MIPILIWMTRGALVNNNNKKVLGAELGAFVYTDQCQMLNDYLEMFEVIGVAETMTSGAMLIEVKTTSKRFFH